MPSCATTISFPMRFFRSARIVSSSSLGLSSTSKMVLAPSMARLPVDKGRHLDGHARVQGEGEGGPLPDLAFGPDLPTVARDDAADGGQADAGAGEFAGGVEALEGPEQLGGVGHVEPGAVVAHEVHRTPLAVGVTKLDRGHCPLHS